MIALQTQTRLLCLSCLCHERHYILYLGLDVARVESPKYNVRIHVQVEAVELMLANELAYGWHVNDATHYHYGIAVYRHHRA
jgi:hypothetical protein